MNSKKKAVSKRPAPKPPARENAAAPVRSSVPPPKPVVRQPLPSHLKVPDILLEDDTLPPGLRARFQPKPVALAEPAVAPAPVSPPPPEPVAPVAPSPPRPAVPVFDGSRRLGLIARDPETLFADWDFSPEEVEAGRRAAKDGLVLLRVFRGREVGPMILEIPVSTDQQHEFIPAPVASACYRAQLGLVTHHDEWHELARSAVAQTPPAAPPPTAPIVPASPMMARVPALPVPSPVTSVELLPAWIREPRAPEPAAWTASLSPSSTSSVAAPAWTPALAGASERLAGPGGPGSVGPGARSEDAGLAASVSSLVAGGPAPGGAPGFWFQVNTEVVIHGATERDARLTIDGRPVRLRPDGSFTCRFSLPDGQFTLPIRAEAADGHTTREAVFHLGKSTERHGDVGAHPLDPTLRPPLAENAVSQ